MVQSKCGKTKVVVENEKIESVLIRKKNGELQVSRRALEMEADEISLNILRNGKWEEYCTEVCELELETWEDAWLSWRIVSHFTEIDNIRLKHDEEEKAKISILKFDYDQITSYFGPEVGVYFAWMNYFTMWLRIPAIVGTLFALRRFWVRVSIDDDPWVPFYSLFIIFWSTAFVAAWPRQEKNFGFVHGVYPPLLKANDFQQLTSTNETNKIFMYAFSIFITGINLVVALSWHIISLNLQGYVSEQTWIQKLLYISTIAHFGRKLRSTCSSFAPTILHVLIVQRLNAFYRIIAEKLTLLEGHETKHEHAQALAVKRFFFEAADAYATLFYLAFIQFDMIQLRSELVNIYSIDSFRRIALESALPMAIKYYSLTSSTNLKNQHAKSKEEENYDDFDDYLEMIIEFGYITLFASALPLGALFSICANYFEVRNDLFKLLYVYPRPIPSPESGLGVWRAILTSIVALGLLTNTALFAFTSEQLRSWVPSLFRKVDPTLDALFITNADDEFIAREGSGRYIVLLAFGLEHVIGIFALLLYIIIPRTSSLVLNDIKRRESDKLRAARALKKSKL